MTDLVVTERLGPVAIVTFNDPARLNPFSDAMRRDALAAIAALTVDSTCRVIVLTGAGSNFSAGADIRQMSGAAVSDPNHARARLRPLHDLIRLVIAGPKPVVAAVEGVAFGAGLSIIAGCDYVVAGEGSRFGAAFGKIGLTADCGLLWSLPKRIGARLARDMMLTGRSVDWTEAQAIALIDRAVPNGEALAAALAKAEEYLAVAPLSIAALKSGLAQGLGSLDAVLELENQQQPVLLMSEDHAEGKEAFLEKRKPAFTGC